MRDGVKPDPNSPKAKPAYRAERTKEGIKAPNKAQEPTLVSTPPSKRPKKGYKNPR